MVKQWIRPLLACWLVVLQYGTCLPCSMYKVTANGKTMVGNNEDSWGRDARIWFEPGGNGKFGMVCLGYALMER